jgi:hypothetical protein
MSKKTKWVNPSSILAALTEIMYNILQQQLSDFKEPDREKYGMDVWYPAIERFTFRSTKYVLSPTQIEDILVSKPNSDLLAHIDDIITNQYSGKVFPRLHYLSPKHYPVCTSAREIFDILVKTTRTFNVLISHRKKGCPLYLREWVSFRKATEVRCFIANGKLTAMCQNDSQAESEPLRRPAVVKRVVADFIGMCLPLVPYRDCTIDVAILRGMPYIVEINTPFDMLAGSGLFSYPQEQHLLANGTINGPLFRYHTDAFFGIGEM